MSKRQKMKFVSKATRRLLTKLDAGCKRKRNTKFSNIYAMKLADHYSVGNTSDDRICDIFLQMIYTDVLTCRELVILFNLCDMPRNETIITNTREENDFKS